jgi:hypothetical protein
MLRLLFILSSLLVAVCVALPKTYVIDDEDLKFGSATSLDRSWENFKIKHGLIHVITFFFIDLPVRRCFISSTTTDTSSLVFRSYNLLY